MGSGCTYLFFRSSFLNYEVKKQTCFVPVLKRLPPRMDLFNEKIFINKGEI